MPVPKKKKYRSHRGNRRAHDKIEGSTWTQVKETGEFIIPHRVSPLGWYKGKKILKTKDERREARASAEAPAAE